MNLKKLFSRRDFYVVEIPEFDGNIEEKSKISEIFILKTVKQYYPQHILIPCYLNDFQIISSVVQLWLIDNWGYITSCRTTKNKMIIGVRHPSLPKRGGKTIILKKNNKIIIKTELYSVYSFIKNAILNEDE